MSFSYTEQTLWVAYASKKTDQLIPDSVSVRCAPHMKGGEGYEVKTSTKSLTVKDELIRDELEGPDHHLDSQI